MICIIPARGGSTRLPEKNIKSLFGTPVINHVIRICIESGIFDDVIVSTDSDSIAVHCDTDVYRDADVYFRPLELCGDVSESDVILEFMERYGESSICRVYPFAALLDSDRLRKGFETFLFNGGTVMERTPYRHPIFRAIKENGDYYDYESVMERTQDLPVFYHDAATFMFTTIDEIKKPLYNRSIKWLNVSGLDCQDVDDADDWEMLKLKFMRLGYK